MTLISTMHDPRPAPDADADAAGSRLVPKIRIAAFCETAETLDAVRAAAADRRMMRAIVEPVTGGTQAAVVRYADVPSPDLIVLERQVPGDLLLEELARLAEVCGPDTRVIVIGGSNDIRLYRALIERGISDYLVSPVDGAALIASVVRLYEQAGAKKPGRVCAFVGAKGGVGSSTVAHNVAATMAERMRLDVILADMDLPFGTAGLDFNLDSAQGVAEALESGPGLDALLFERLLGRCSDRLAMLAAPAALDRAYDLGEDAPDALVDAARACAGQVVLDMPHLWSGWARRMLTAADEVVVTAAPDLANLRNAKSLVEALQKARPNDAPPRLVLNQVGMAKRPEIPTAEFARAVGIEPVAVIAFEPKLYGTAANNGQMIADLAARSARPFAAISEALTGAGARRRPAGEGLLSRFVPRGLRA